LLLKLLHLSILLRRCFLSKFELLFSVSGIIGSLVEHRLQRVQLFLNPFLLLLGMV
jgi:hypothetical protein